MKFLSELDVDEKTVLVQMALDVPLRDGVISDDSRLRASLPTLQYLLEKNCRVVVVGHVGRPKGDDPSLSTRPVATRLAELLGRDVEHVQAVVGEVAAQAVSQAAFPSVVMLENVRFHPGETGCDEEFARELASLADVFVNDDYPDAHRAYAVNTLVPNLLPSAAGISFATEVERVSSVNKNPKKPFVLIVGGAKADKIGVINHFLSVADHIIVGGVLANTFLKASGVDIGGSKFDERSLEIAGEFLRDAEEKFLLPTDVVVAREFSSDAEHKECSVSEVSSGWLIVDIGSHSAKRAADVISSAGTVVWGGPIGVFEFAPFRNGTEVVARALAGCDGFTLVGGGDSGDAVRALNLEKKMSHVSIGGGATLRLLAEEELAAIVALSDA